MISYTFYPELSLHYLRAEQSASLLGIVEYGMDLGQSAGPEANLDLPAFFDLRAIDLSVDTTLSIKKAIRLRKSLKPETGGNPCAYVMGDLGSFGMMRMYGIYADLEGLRDESLTLVTVDYDEAVEWLVEKAGVDAHTGAAMRRQLRANERQLAP